MFLHELNGLQIQTSGFDFQVSSLQRLLYLQIALMHVAQKGLSICAMYRYAIVQLRLS